MHVCVSQTVAGAPKTKLARGRMTFFSVVQRQLCYNWHMVGRGRPARLLHHSRPPALLRMHFRIMDADVN